MSGIKLSVILIIFLPWNLAGHGILITCNPFYLTTDIIHYSCYLGDSEWKYYALELVNNEGTPVIQKKNYAKGNWFSGQLFLRNTLPSGIYWLRAYPGNIFINENDIIYCPVVIISNDDLFEDRWKKVFFYPVGNVSIYHLKKHDLTSQVDSITWMALVDDIGKIYIGSGIAKNNSNGSEIPVKFNSNGLFQIPWNTNQEIQLNLALYGSDSLNLSIDNNCRSFTFTESTGRNNVLKSGLALDLIPDKPKYNPRDLVNIELLVKGKLRDIKDSLLIITVNDNCQGLVHFNNSPVILISESSSGTKNREIKNSVHNNELFLSGSFIDPITNLPRIDDEIALIGLGNKPSCAFTRVDKNGNFFFDLKNTLETNRYYLSTVSPSLEGLTWKDDFFREIKEIPLVYFDSADLSALIEYIKVAEIRNILVQQYSVKNKKEPASSEQILFDTTQVYPKPDARYNLSDYIQFENVEDLIRNILINVHIVKSTKNKQIFIYNKQSPWLNRDPLFLINGIPTRNDSLVKNLQINDIKRIDILSLRTTLIPFNLSGLGGVMSIYTNQNIKIPGCVITDIIGLTEQKDEFIPLLNKEYPDLTPTVYWNANWIVKKNMERISFRLNDVLTDLKVRVTGFDMTGKIIQSEIIIKINNH